MNGIVAKGKRAKSRRKTGAPITGAKGKSAKSRPHLQPSGASHRPPSSLRSQPQPTSTSLPVNLCKEAASLSIL